MDKEQALNEIKSNFAILKTEKGKKVLQYLMENNFVGETTLDESGNSLFQSYKEGRRAVILDILALAEIDLTNLGE